MSGDSSPTRAWTAPTFGVPYGALCQAILFQPALGLPQWKRGSFHICISHPSERRSSSSALRSQEGCQGPRAGGELPTPAAQPGELSGEARTAQASTGKNCPALPKRRRAHQGSREPTSRQDRESPHWPRDGRQRCPTHTSIGFILSSQKGPTLSLVCPFKYYNTLLGTEFFKTVNFLGEEDDTGSARMKNK